MDRTAKRTNSPEVNLSDLSIIADRAALRNTAAREARIQEEKREERRIASAEGRTANKAAREIIERIPGALKKAAQRAEKRGQKVLVTRVNAVCERFWSIMDTSGCLSDEDSRTLKALKKQLKDLHIPGVTITLEHKVLQGGFQSADGLDETYGPKKQYFLKVEATLKDVKGKRAGSKKKKEKA